MRASCLSLLDSIVDLRRAPGRAGPALLCVWLATACSATRAYEGPALSKDQVATISEYPRGVGAMFGSVGRQLALGTDWSSELAGVDDGEDVSLWNDGGAEVLPGRHAVRVTVVEQSVAGTSFHRDLLAVFDAAAGHEYELRARGPTLGGAPGFDVWDVQADAAIASSDARPEECVTARTAWDGRHWTQADWGRNAGLCSTSYVPSGQVLSSWSEIVELQYFRTRGGGQPLSLDEVMAIKLEDLEHSGDNAFQTPLESAPGLRVFTWSAVEAGDRPQQGVTCLREGPHGFHVLVYAVRGVLEPSVAAAWAARFKTAELLPPGY